MGHFTAAKAAAEETRPVITKRLTMHLKLQGGHAYTWAILRNGEATGITLNERSERGTLIERLLVASGQESLDLLDPDQAPHMREWIDRVCAGAGVITDPYQPTEEPKELNNA